MKVGELFATLALNSKQFQTQLNQARKLGDQFTKQFSKPISTKGMFANINKDASAASQAAANAIKNNIGSAVKGIDASGLKAALNFKIDAGPLNSITTGINGISIAAGLAASAVGAMANAISSGMGAIIDKGMSFEQQMSAVAAITFAGQDMGSAEVQAAFKALEDQAISLGSSTTFTAEEVGQAQELLARAGFSVNETLSATPGLLAAAAAEGLGLADTAAIASAALRGFGLEADQMGMVADVLAKTSATSNASIQGMGESFKYIAPVAQAVGLNIHDVSAALGMLANMGIQGSVAGRNLASGLMSLANPSEKAKALMQDLGISVSDANGQFLELPAVMSQVAKATEGVTEAEALKNIAILVGKDNAKTYLGILNSQYKTMQDGKEVTLSGAQALEVYSQALQGSEGAAEAMANIRLDNLAGDMERLSGAADAMAIQMYQKAQPALRAMAQGATSALETIAPVAVEAFGAIVDGAMMIRDAAMPGLIAAWNALKPAISSIVPIIGNVLGGFAVFASQAAAWGAKIIAGLAQGMAQAVARVVAVLKYIGSIISYWLKPNSPPKIVPQLDQYGQEAGQLYADSIATADVSGPLQALGSQLEAGFSNLATDAGVTEAGTAVAEAFIAGMQNWNSSDFQIFNDLTNVVEESFRALGESGVLAKDAVVPAILESRSAVQDFVNQIKEVGYVSEESIGELLNSLGPIAPEVSNVIDAYGELISTSIELAEANKAVAEAQEELNSITEEYDAKLSPLQSQLEGLQAEQERLKNAKRIADLQEKIASGKLDENELAQAQLELQEIQLKDQIDAIEQEKQGAVDVAEEKLKAAEEQQELAEKNQQAAQAQYDAAMAQIEASRENNSLLQEQVKILADIKSAQEAAASAGGGLGGMGGGGMPEMPGMPDIEDMATENPFAEFEESVSNISGTISELQQGFNDGRTAVDNFFNAFTNPAIPNFNTQLSTVTGVIQTVAGYISGTFLPPLSYLGSLLQGNIIPTIQNFGNQVSQTFSERIGPLLAQFGSNWQTIGSIFVSLQPAFTGLIAMLGAGLMGALSGLIGMLTGALPGAMTMLQGLWQIMQGGIEAILGPIVNLGVAFGKVLAGDIPGATAALQGAWSSFASGISNITEGLVIFVVGAMSTMAGGLAGIWDGIYSSITGKASTLSDDVIAAADRMRAEAIVAFEQFKSKAIEAITNLASDIDKKITEFVASGNSVGKGIVDGIAAGVRAGYEAVKKAVASLAAAIPQWAKDMLGIKSPSKEMIPIGEFTAEGLAVGITKGIPFIHEALVKVEHLIVTTLQGVREDARYLFNDIGELFKSVSTFLSSVSSGVGIIGGLIPNKDSMQDARKRYDELLRDLRDASEGIEDIDKELAEKRKKIQDDLVDAIKSANEKIIDLQKERAEIEEELANKGNDSESKAIERQIARLESIALPDDVLMQERIAALRDKLAEKQKEDEEEINDLMERRLEIDSELQDTQLTLDETRLKLQEELVNAEQNADRDRQEALKTQLDLLKRIQDTKLDFDREQSNYNNLQSIAENTQKIFNAARVQLGELQSLNPEVAASFFNALQRGVGELAKLEQQFLTEALNPAGADDRVLNTLRQQIALTRQQLGIDMQGLRFSEIGEIDNLLTDDDPESPERKAALELQRSMIESLDLLKNLPEWLNTGMNMPRTELPGLPQALEDSINDRAFDERQVDLESLFNRLITAISGSRNNTTNYTVNETAVNNGSMSTTDYLRLMQLARG